MKVTLDRDGCLGCGLCAAACPEVFGMADDGLAEIVAQPAEESGGSAEEAAAGCPAGVITAEN